MSHGPSWRVSGGATMGGSSPGAGSSPVSSGGDVPAPPAPGSAAPLPAPAAPVFMSMLPTLGGPSAPVGCAPVPSGSDPGEALFGTPALGVPVFGAAGFGVPPPGVGVEGAREPSVSRARVSYLSPQAAMVPPISAETDRAKLSLILSIMGSTGCREDRGVNQQRPR